MSDSDQFRLDWAVDAITVGTRHRQDLGDLDALAESISQVGLLQPITINRDGVLICGARRLAAIKKLGWKTVNVWMRMGLSGRLTALMAERDDVVLHKAYTRVELAEMYTELKDEIAADNARRQQASHFVEGHNPLSNGDAESAPPPDSTRGDSRRQAAQMLGGASHYQLEQIAAIQAIASDPRRDPELRRQARLALKQIEDGSPVDPLFHQLRPAVQLDDLDIIAADETEPAEAREAARSGAILIRKYNQETPMTPEDLDKVARAALNRVNAARKGKKPKDPTPKPKPVTPPAPKKKTAKSFLWLWDSLADWPDDYDTEVIAQAIPDDKWLRFKQTIAATIEFMQAVDKARAARAFAA